MSITKFNRQGSRFTSVKSDLSQFPNLSAKEALAKYKGDPVRINAVFISKHGYNYPQVITDTEFIRLPLYLSESVSNILGDAAVIEDINAGKCGVRFTTWTDRQGKEHVGADFVDL